MAWCKPIDSKIAHARLTFERPPFPIEGALEAAFE